MNSQIALYNDRPPATLPARSPASIKFKAKPIEYREGFSNGGIVKRRGCERYGIIRFRSDKVIVSWDDGEKTTHPSLEGAKNWDLIEPVPWFIAGQTVVILPRFDGSIAPECEYRVVAVDSNWVEVKQLIGDRIEKYPIGELPGFPFRNDIVIKERPLLPIPVRHKLKFAAGERYLWDKQLVDLIGKKNELYSIFRQEQSRMSESEEDFVWAWEEEWNQFVRLQARDFGHGGKKIGTRLYVEGAIEQVVDFDTEAFEFIANDNRRIPLLQIYLYPELAIDRHTSNFYVLSAGEFMEARIGFDNKQEAKKSEVLIKRVSKCREPRLDIGVYTNCKYEWVVVNPFKKTETFLTHLTQLAKMLPK